MNRLLLAARESESGETEAEQRECGGFGDCDHTVIVLKLFERYIRKSIPGDHFGVS